MSEIEAVLGAWGVPLRSVEQAGVPGIYHVDSQDGERYVLKNVGGLDMMARTEVQYRVTRHVHPVLRTRARSSVVGYTLVLFP